MYAAGLKKIKNISQYFKVDPVFFIRKNCSTAHWSLIDMVSSPITHMINFT